MRVLIRTSLPALWSRRLGSLALPVAILPVFMHRERLVTSSEFVTIELVALGLAGLAVVLAVIGFFRLWFTGDRGWGKAVAGLIFGLICLAPFGFYGYQAWRYPALGDASTDFARPLVLVGTQAPEALNIEAQQGFAALYPNARTRTYPIEATEMHEIVGRLVEERGWEVLADTAPADGLATGETNAIAMTLLGFRDEVALRIDGRDTGSSVAMRSVAFARPYDFGENGHRIEEFLAALDQQVTLLMRNAPVAPTADADSEAPPVATEDDGTEAE
jgi:hypothetical protein